MSYNGGFTNSYAQKRSRDDDSYGSRDSKRAKPAVGNGKPIQKDFYKEHPTLAALSESEVKAFRDGSNISIIGNPKNAPKPIRSFEEASFPDYVYDSIKKAGFASPSPIQAQGWPVALSGRDLIGVAETGSGKTLAFLLPALIHINAQEKLNWGELGPICLVLAPTRELVTQIEVECKKFCGRIGCTSLVGGMPKGPQIRDLRAQKEIVIATPGRLIDLLDMDLGFNLNRVSYLCLDEADRMLDMGFEKPLRTISGKIRSDKQMVMFSATWPKEVQRLARELCTAGTDPVHIHIGEGVAGELKCNNRITQHVEVFRGRSYDERMDRAKMIIKQQEPGGKIIIFAKTKLGCDGIARKLERDFGALAIHGDKSQWDRDWALAEFSKKDNCRYPILVATDVAARGLDVKGVTCVINFDFPLDIENYVHRIGRTGRAGTYGSSYSFFVADDLTNPGKSASCLIKMLKEADQKVPEELHPIAAMRSSGKGGKGGKGKGGGKGGFRGGKGGFSGGGFSSRPSGGFSARY